MGYKSPFMGYKSPFMGYIRGQSFWIATEANNTTVYITGLFANVLVCINMMLPDSRISLSLHGIQDNPVSLETEALIFVGFSL